MPSTDGIIRRREKVELKRAQVAIVEKLYDKNLLDRTVVEEITYLSDGLNINGYLAHPRGKEPRPTLIWNRGGFGDRGAIDDLTAYLIMASTAAWGYTVIGTQYRGNMGSEGDDEWGDCDLTDSLNLIKAAENIPECNLDKMAVEGPSRGGMVTYRALREKDCFKCGIIHAGITDLFALTDQKPRFKETINNRFGDLSEEELNESLKNLSAVHFADKLPKNVPILIMHGTDDNVIPISQSEALVEKLKKFGVQYKFIRIDGGTHFALKDGSYKEIDKYRKEWLDAYLK